MKKIILLILANLSFFTLSAQNKKLPIIDMHVHVYSPSNYWGGFDFVLEDTILYSPKNYDEHIKSVVQQMKDHNIVLSYASGNFEALDSIKRNHPYLFFPSAEIWPTEELLTDKTFLNTLKSKIKNGEVVSIGEVANFYTGFKPNDPIMDTLYRLAETYDLPIGLHFSAGPPGSQLNTYPNARLEYANPFLLQDVLINYPKLRVSIMHAGVPFYEDETFAMLFMFPNNLYVDISALTWYENYSKVSLTEFLKKAVAYGFVNRIMFGSDEMTWPETIGLSVEFIENADFLTEEQKRDIFYNNAARFLNLDDETIKNHHNSTSTK